MSLTQELPGVVLEAEVNGKPSSHHHANNWLALQNRTRVPFPDLVSASNYPSSKKLSLMHSSLPSGAPASRATAEALLHSRALPAPVLRPSVHITGKRRLSFSRYQDQQLPSCDGLALKVSLFPVTALASEERDNSNSLQKLQHAGA